MPKINYGLLFADLEECFVIYKKKRKENVSKTLKWAKGIAGCPSNENAGVVFQSLGEVGECYQRVCSSDRQATTKVFYDSAGADIIEKESNASVSCPTQYKANNSYS